VAYASYSCKGGAAAATKVMAATHLLPRNKPRKTSTDVPALAGLHHSNIPAEPCSG
jgi:hypothetical protein